MNRAIIDLGRVLLTLVIVAAAIAALALLWRRYERGPWTRQAQLVADTVAVSSDAPGIVTRVLVTDNQFVRAGTVMFIVDGERYGARFEQASAAVARARLAKGPRAQIDLAQAVADRNLARVDFDRSSVEAGVDGYVTGLSLHPGEYAQRGHTKFTLIAASTFHVVGQFEEAKLRAIAIGDRARIDVLGEPHPLWGHVESLAARTAAPVQTSDASASFTWVRVARRIPVRIAIDQTPVDMRLIAGRTATVRLSPAAPLNRN